MALKHFLKPFAGNCDGRECDNFIFSIIQGYSKSLGISDWEIKETVYVSE